MDHLVEHDGGNTLVVFTHPHHEDLVDARDDGLPFFQGMPVEGTDYEAVTLGPDLKDDFKFRRQFAKHFMVSLVIAREAYNHAMVFANTPRISPYSWYFARRFGRAQERVFIQKTLAALRELTIMMRIIDLLVVYHQHGKPEVEFFNPGTILAAVCFPIGLMISDVLVGGALMGCAIGHMIVLYFPLVAHIFLGFMLGKCKNTVQKVHDTVQQGGATKADADVLDDWKFWFLGFVVPQKLGFTTIYL